MQMIANNELVVSVVIYLTAIAVVTVIETLIFNEPLQKHERARTTMGVITVWLLAFMVRAETAWEMWAVWLLGYGVAGAATVSADIWRAVRGQSQAREAFKEVVNRA